jgi:hypothetical protein
VWHPAGFTIPARRTALPTGQPPPNNPLQGMRGRACFRPDESLARRPAPLTLVALGRYTSSIVNQQRMLSLRAAVEMFQQEPGAEQNAYDWYRRSANRCGSVSLGGTEIPVHKRGRAWVIDEACLEKAIANHRSERAQMLDNTMLTVAVYSRDSPEITSELHGEATLSRTTSTRHTVFTRTREYEDGSVTRA